MDRLGEKKYSQVLLRTCFKCSLIRSPVLKHQFEQERSRNGLYLTYYSVKYVCITGYRLGRGDTAGKRVKWTLVMLGSDANDFVKEVCKTQVTSNLQLSHRTTKARIYV